MSCYADVHAARSGLSRSWKLAMSRVPASVLYCITFAYVLAHRTAHLFGSNPYSLNGLYDREKQDGGTAETCMRMPDQSAVRSYVGLTKRLVAGDPR
jgi:hypothetical protein